jgi:hypothetical protein
MCTETDLVYTDGSTKNVKLNDQQPLVRTVVQDSIENLRALLLFNDAFPDPVAAFRLAKGALTIAAENREADGVLVLHRLQDDDEYVAKLITLVRQLILVMTLLIFFVSHVHVYAFSVLKSRIAAMQFVLR